MSINQSSCLDSCKYMSYKTLIYQLLGIFHYNMGSEQVALFSRGVSTDQYRNYLKVTQDHLLFGVAGGLIGFLATTLAGTPGAVVSGGGGAAQVILWFLNNKFLASDRIGLSMGAGLIGGTIAALPLTVFPEILPETPETARARSFVTDLKANFGRYY